jgi:hypothetical protein
MSSPATTSSNRAMVRAASPLITMGATWAVRKSMISIYEARTGKPAPLVYSRDASLVSKVVWAATMAGVIALIEVAVTQLIGSDD